MLQGEHSAILPFAIKIFVLSIFEWPFYTGFTVHCSLFITLCQESIGIGFQDQLSLNAGQKYCRMLQGEHSSILSPSIKLPIVIKIFLLSIFEWQFYINLTAHCMLC